MFFVDPTTLLEDLNFNQMRKARLPKSQKMVIVFQDRAFLFTCYQCEIHHVGSFNIIAVTVI